MQPTLPLALLLLTAGLAGCLGGSEDLATPPANAGDNGVGQDAVAPNATRMVYPGAEHVFGVAWANGTFTLDQSDQLLHPVRAAGQEPGNRERIDVTDRIPAGQPVFVAAEINAEVGEGDVDIWLETPDAAVWTTDFDSPFGGYTRIEFVLVRPADATVTLVAQLDEVPDREEVPYTLSIDVRSHPELLLRGVPVQVPAGPGHTFELTSLDDGGEIQALVFDPEDRFVDRLESIDTATLALGDEAPSGAYALMLTEATRPARLAVTAPAGQPPVDPSLGLVEQTFTTGQPQALGTEGQATWSFQADRVPLQVGIGVQGAGIAQDLQASLAGPEGQLLDIAIQDGPWVQPGFFFLTPMGEPGLTAGSYEGQVAFGAEAGGQAEAFHVLVHYAR